MNTTLASLITKDASKQTYYTIRFLVDRDRVDDAYRAYAYFRWMDDVIDVDSGSQSERLDFLARQGSLLESCYRGQVPRNANLQEQMLVELVQHDPEKNSGLHSYLYNMMQVIDFDARRRGRLISQSELKEYTRWLSHSVTDALHYFIGHDHPSPQDERRTLAVSAAHITHMLRDTFEDLRAGYYNIPREVLEENHMGPQDVHSEAYRAWVKSRVGLAREHFESGKGYLARIQNPRCRLAGFAYAARFECLLDTIEKESFYLRSEYKERKSIGTALQMSWLLFLDMANLRGAGTLPRPGIQHTRGKL